MRESADGLSRWLTEVFEENRLQPDSLFLVGSRGDLELISGSVEAGTVDTRSIAPRMRSWRWRAAPLCRRRQKPLQQLTHRQKKRPL